MVCVLWKVEFLDLQNNLDSSTNIINWMSQGDTFPVSFY